MTAAACALVVAAPVAAQPANDARSKPMTGPVIELRSVHIVGRAAADGAWTDAATEARQGEGAELAVIAIATERPGSSARSRRSRRGRRVYLVDDAIETLRVAGRRVRASERRPWSALGPVEVQWSTVEPHAWREPERAAPNGTTSRYHSNVSMERGSFGKWLGFDEITYFETVVASWSAADRARRRPASARPPRRADDVWGGLGTMRYKAEVRAGGQTWATPGADATDKFGIRPSVHRVSIRADDSFIGHVTGYFMVPEVFGSAGPGRNHQTERFVGADCADVLTGALRRTGHRRVWHTSVSALGRYTRPVSAAFAIDEDGRTAEPIAGVAVGDLIRINYGGAYAGHTPRGWDHVAALYEDRSDPDGPHRGGPDGALDGFDLVVHMGHPRLVVEPLARQAPATLDVLRWDPRKIGRRKPAR